MDIVIKKMQHIKLNYYILNVYNFMACHQVSHKLVIAMADKKFLNTELVLHPSNG